MRVGGGVGLSPPLIDSTKRNVSRRNTTTALQKDFRRLEVEIYDQKKCHKSLPSVGNFNCSVICSSCRQRIEGVGRPLLITTRRDLSSRMQTLRVVHFFRGSRRAHAPPAQGGGLSLQLLRGGAISQRG